MNENQVTEKQIQDMNCKTAKDIMHALMKRTSEYNKLGYRFLIELTYGHDNGEDNIVKISSRPIDEKS